MKKQSSGANSDRQDVARQDVSAGTPVSGRPQTGSHPKGAGNAKPTQLNAGAAGPHLVETPKSSSRSSTSPGSSGTHSAQSSSRNRVH
jgi:hypothetical protein